MSSEGGTKEAWKGSGEALLAAFESLQNTDPQTEEESPSVIRKWSSDELLASCQELLDGETSDVVVGRQAPGGATAGLHDSTTLQHSPLVSTPLSPAKHLNTTHISTELTHTPHTRGTHPNTPKAYTDKIETTHQPFAKHMDTTTMSTSLTHTSHPPQIPTNPTHTKLSHFTLTSAPFTHTTHSLVTYHSPILTHTAHTLMTHIPVACIPSSVKKCVNSTPNTASTSLVPSNTVSNPCVPLSTTTNTPVPFSTSPNTPVTFSTTHNTPVPSSTASNPCVPLSTATNTPVPLSTTTNTPVPLSTTNTPVPLSTATNTPVPLSTTTNTPVPLITTTNTPVPLSTTTNTPVPLSTTTNTPVPLSTTNTPVPLITTTNTPVPLSTTTNTPVPLSTTTNTPVPLSTTTNTPVPLSTTTNTPVPLSTTTNTPVPLSTTTNTPVPLSTTTNTPVPLSTTTNTPVPLSTTTNTPVPLSTTPNTPAQFSTTPNPPVSISVAIHTSIPYTSPHITKPDALTANITLINTPDIPEPTATTPYKSTPQNATQIPTTQLAPIPHTPSHHLSMTTPYLTNTCPRDSVHLPKDSLASSPPPPLSPPLPPPPPPLLQHSLSPLSRPVSLSPLILPSSSPPTPLQRLYAPSPPPPLSPQPPAPHSSLPSPPPSPIKTTTHSPQSSSQTLFSPELKPRTDSSPPTAKPQPNRPSKRKLPEEFDDSREFVQLQNMRTQSPVTKTRLDENKSAAAVRDDELDGLGGGISYDISPLDSSSSQSLERRDSEWQLRNECGRERTSSSFVPEISGCQGIKMDITVAPSSPTAVPLAADAKARIISQPGGLRGSVRSPTSLRSGTGSVQCHGAFGSCLGSIQSPSSPSPSLGSLPVTADPLPRYKKRCCNVSSGVNVWISSQGISHGNLDAPLSPSQAPMASQDVFSAELGGAECSAQSTCEEKYKNYGDNKDAINHTKGERGSVIFEGNGRFKVDNVDQSAELTCQDLYRHDGESRLKRSCSKENRYSDVSEGNCRGKEDNVDQSASRRSSNALGAPLSSLSSSSCTNLDQGLPVGEALVSDSEDDSFFSLSTSASEGYEYWSLGASRESVDRGEVSDEEMVFAAPGDLGDFELNPSQFSPPEGVWRWNPSYDNESLVCEDKTGKRGSEEKEREDEKYETRAEGNIDVHGKSKEEENGDTKEKEEVGERYEKYRNIKENVHGKGEKNNYENECKDEVGNANEEKGREKIDSGNEEQGEEDKQYEKETKGEDEREDKENKAIREQQTKQEKEDKTDTIEVKGENGNEAIKENESETEGNAGKEDIPANTTTAVSVTSQALKMGVPDSVQCQQQLGEQEEEEETRCLSHSLLISSPTENYLTTTQRDINILVQEGGIENVAQDGDIENVTMEGGIENVAMEGGIANVGQDGDIIHVTMEGGNESVAMEGGIENVAMEGGIENVAMDGGIENVAMEGGIEHFAMEGAIDNVAMEGCIENVAQMGDIDNVDGDIGNVARDGGIENDDREGNMGKVAREAAIENGDRNRDSAARKGDINNDARKGDIHIDAQESRSLVHSLDATHSCLSCQSTHRHIIEATCLDMHSSDNGRPRVNCLFNCTCQNIQRNIIEPPPVDLSRQMTGNSTSEALMYPSSIYLGSEASGSTISSKTRGKESEIDQGNAKKNEGVGEYESSTDDREERCVTDSMREKDNVIGKLKVDGSATGRVKDEYSAIEAEREQGSATRRLSSAKEEKEESSVIGGVREKNSAPEKYRVELNIIVPRREVSTREEGGATVCTREEERATGLTEEEEEEGSAMREEEEREGSASTRAPPPPVPSEPCHSHLVPVSSVPNTHRHSQDLPHQSCPSAQPIGTSLTYGTEVELSVGVVDSHTQEVDQSTITVPVIASPKTHGSKQKEDLARSTSFALKLQDNSGSEKEKDHALVTISNVISSDNNGNKTEDKIKTTFPFSQLPEAHDINESNSSVGPAKNSSSEDQPLNFGSLQSATTTQTYSEAIGPVTVISQNKVAKDDWARYDSLDGEGEAVAGGQNRGEEAEGRRVKVREAIGGDARRVDARETEACGGEAIGGEGRGGEARGGDTSGCEARGDAASKGESRGGEASRGEARAGEARAGEARGNARKGIGEEPGEVIDSASCDVTTFSSEGITEVNPRDSKGMDKHNIRGRDMRFRLLQPRDVAIDMPGDADTPTFDSQVIRDMTSSEVITGVDASSISDSNININAQHPITVTSDMYCDTTDHDSQVMLDMTSSIMIAKTIQPSSGQDMSKDVIARSYNLPVSKDMSEMTNYSSDVNRTITPRTPCPACGESKRDCDNNCVMFQKLSRPESLPVATPDLAPLFSPTTPCSVNHPPSSSPDDLLPSSPLSHPSCYSPHRSIPHPPSLSGYFSTIPHSSHNPPHYCVHHPSSIPKSSSVPYPTSLNRSVLPKSQTSNLPFPIYSLESSKSPPSMLSTQLSQATCIPPSQKIPSASQPIPHPSSSIQAPITSVPSPSQPLPHLSLSLDTPLNPLAHPSQFLPHPSQLLPHPTQPFPHPLPSLTSVPSPTQPLPNPSQPLPRPSEPLPHPSQPLPHPSQTLPHPTHTFPSLTPVPSPNQPLPHPSLPLTFVPSPNQPPLPSTRQQLPQLSPHPEASTRSKLRLNPIHTLALTPLQGLSGVPIQSPPSLAAISSGAQHATYANLATGQLQQANNSCPHQHCTLPTTCTSAVPQDAGLSSTFTSFDPLCTTLPSTSIAPTLQHSTLPSTFTSSASQHTAIASSTPQHTGTTLITTLPSSAVPVPTIFTLHSQHTPLPSTSTSYKQILPITSFTASQSPTVHTTSTSSATYHSTSTPSQQITLSRKSTSSIPNQTPYPSTSTSVSQPPIPSTSSTPEQTTYPSISKTSTSSLPPHTTSSTPEQTTYPSISTTLSKTSTSSLPPHTTSSTPEQTTYPSISTTLSKTSTSSLPPHTTSSTPEQTTYPSTSTTLSKTSTSSLPPHTTSFTASSDHEEGISRAHEQQDLIFHADKIIIDDDGGGELKSSVDEYVSCVQDVHGEIEGRGDDGDDDGKYRSSFGDGNVNRCIDKDNDNSKLKCSNNDKFESSGEDDNDEFISCVGDLKSLNSNKFKEIADDVDSEVRECVDGIKSPSHRKFKELADDVNGGLKKCVGDFVEVSKCVGDVENERAKPVPHSPQSATPPSLPSPPSPSGPSPPEHLIPSAPELRCESGSPNPARTHARTGVNNEIYEPLGGEETDQFINKRAEERGGNVERATAVVVECEGGADNFNREGASVGRKGEDVGVSEYGVYHALPVVVLQDNSTPPHSPLDATEQPIECKGYHAESVDDEATGCCDLACWHPENECQVPGGAGSGTECGVAGSCGDGTVGEAHVAQCPGQVLGSVQVLVRDITWLFPLYGPHQEPHHEAHEWRLVLAGCGWCTAINSAGELVTMSSSTNMADTEHHSASTLQQGSPEARIHGPVYGFKVTSNESVRNLVPAFRGGHSSARDVNNVNFRVKGDSTWQTQHSNRKSDMGDVQMYRKSETCDDSSEGSGVIKLCGVNLGARPASLNPYPLFRCHTLPRKLRLHSVPSYSQEQYVSQGGLPEADLATSEPASPRLPQRLVPGVPTPSSYATPNLVAWQGARVNYDPSDLAPPPWALLVPGHHTHNTRPRPFTRGYSDLTPGTSSECTPMSSRDITPDTSRQVTPSVSREIIPTTSREISPVTSREATPTPEDSITPTPLESIVSTLQDDSATPTPLDSIHLTLEEESATPTPLESITRNWIETGQGDTQACKPENKSSQQSTMTAQLKTLSTIDTQELCRKLEHPIATSIAANERLEGIVVDSEAPISFLPLKKAVVPPALATIIEPAAENSDASESPTLPCPPVNLKTLGPMVKEKMAQQIVNIESQKLRNIENSGNTTIHEKPDIEKEPHETQILRDHENTSVTEKASIKPEHSNNQVLRSLDHPRSTTGIGQASIAEKAVPIEEPPSVESLPNHNQPKHTQAAPRGESAHHHNESEVRPFASLTEEPVSSQSHSQQHSLNTRFTEHSRHPENMAESESPAKSESSLDELPERQTEYEIIYMDPTEAENEKVVSDRDVHRSKETGEESNEFQSKEMGNESSIVISENENEHILREALIKSDDHNEPLNEANHSDYKVYESESISNSDETQIAKNNNDAPSCNVIYSESQFGKNDNIALNINDEDPEILVSKEVSENLRNNAKYSECPLAIADNNVPSNKKNESENMAEDDGTEDSNNDNTNLVILSPPHAPRSPPPQPSDKINTKGDGVQYSDDNAQYSGDYVQGSDGTVDEGERINVGCDKLIDNTDSCTVDIISDKDIKSVKDGKGGLTSAAPLSSQINFVKEDNVIIYSVSSLSKRNNRIQDDAISENESVSNDQVVIAKDDIKSDSDKVLNEKDDGTNENITNVNNSSVSSKVRGVSCDGVTEGEKGGVKKKGKKGGVKVKGKKGGTKENVTEGGKKDDSRVTSKEDSESNLNMSRCEGSLGGTDEARGRGQGGESGARSREGSVGEGGRLGPGIIGLAALLTRQQQQVGGQSRPRPTHFPLDIISGNKIQQQQQLGETFKTQQQLLEDGGYRLGRHRLSSLGHVSPLAPVPSHSAARSKSASRADSGSSTSGVNDSLLTPVPSTLATCDKNQNSGKNLQPDSSRPAVLPLDEALKDKIQITIDSCVDSSFSPEAATTHLLSRDILVPLIINTEDGIQENSEVTSSDTQSSHSSHDQPTIKASEGDEILPLAVGINLMTASREVTNTQHVLIATPQGNPPDNVQLYCEEDAYNIDLPLSLNNQGVVKEVVSACDIEEKLATLDTQIEQTQNSLHLSQDESNSQLENNRTLPKDKKNYDNEVIKQLKSDTNQYEKVTEIPSNLDIMRPDICGTVQTASSLLDCESRLIFIDEDEAKEDELSTELENEVSSESTEHPIYANLVVSLKENSRAKYVTVSALTEAVRSPDLDSEVKALSVGIEEPKPVPLRIVITEPPSSDAVGMLSRDESVEEYEQALEVVSPDPTHGFSHSSASVATVVRVDTPQGPRIHPAEDEIEETEDNYVDASDGTESTKDQEEGQILQSHRKQKTNSAVQSKTHSQVESSSLYSTDCGAIFPSTTDTLSSGISDKSVSQTVGQLASSTTSDEASMSVTDPHSLLVATSKPESEGAEDGSASSGSRITDPDMLASASASSTGSETWWTSGGGPVARRDLLPLDEDEEEVKWRALLAVNLPESDDEEPTGYESDEDFDAMDADMRRLEEKLKKFERELGGPSAEQIETSNGEKKNGSSVLPLILNTQDIDSLRIAALPKVYPTVCKAKTKHLSLMTRLEVEEYDESGSESDTDSEEVSSSDSADFLFVKTKIKLKPGDRRCRSLDQKRPKNSNVLNKQNEVQKADYEDNSCACEENLDLSNLNLPEEALNDGNDVLCLAEEISAVDNITDPCYLEECLPESEDVLEEGGNEVPGNEENIEPVLWGGEDQILLGCIWHEGDMASVDFDGLEDFQSFEGQGALMFIFEDDGDDEIFSDCEGISDIRDASSLSPGNVADESESGSSASPSTPHRSDKTFVAAFKNSLRKASKYLGPRSESRPKKSSSSSDQGSPHGHSLAPYSHALPERPTSITVEEDSTAGVYNVQSGRLAAGAVITPLSDSEGPEVSCSSGEFYAAPALCINTSDEDPATTARLLHSNLPLHINHSGTSQPPAPPPRWARLKPGVGIELDARAAQHPRTMEDTGHSYPGGIVPPPLGIAIPPPPSFSHSPAPTNAEGDDKQFYVVGIPTTETGSYRQTVTPRQQAFSGVDSGIKTNRRSDVDPGIATSLSHGAPHPQIPGHPDAHLYSDQYPDINNWTPDSRPQYILPGAGPQARVPHNHKLIPHGANPQLGVSAVPCHACCSAPSHKPTSVKQLKRKQQDKILRQEAEDLQEREGCTFCLGVPLARARPPEDAVHWRQPSPHPRALADRRSWPLRK